MSYERERTASATMAAEYVVLEPVAARDVLRGGIRALATAALLVVFAYCVWTAWDVLQGLGRVSLADMAQGLRVVSVRDAILCVIGYRVGRELLTALLQRRAAR
jgi:hypothetical protein